MFCFVVVFAGVVPAAVAVVAAVYLQLMSLVFCCAIVFIAAVIPAAAVVGVADDDFRFFPSRFGGAVEPSDGSATLRGRAHRGDVPGEVGVEVGDGRRRRRDDDDTGLGLQDIGTSRGQRADHEGVSG